jgi:hypothetical protein
VEPEQIAAWLRSTFRSSRSGIRVDAQRGESLGEVFDPGRRCSVVRQGDACFTAPQCAAEGRAQMPGHHTLSYQVVAGGLPVVAHGGSQLHTSGAEPNP